MTVKEKLSMLENPEVFQENRLAPFSDHRFYETREEAEADREMKLSLCLSGNWKFSYAANPESAPNGFEAMEFSDRGWAEIPVPGHMELNGYGKPQYTDTSYPWDGVEQVPPHELPKEKNPTGCYVKYFNLPKHMAGKRLELRFEGVETAFHCWLNGVYVGYSEDSYTPAAFDVTKHIHEGENKLAVEVYRFSSGAWLEDQDFWRMGGIVRDVFLTALPQDHIRDIDLSVDLEDSYTTGKADVKITVESNSPWNLAGEGRLVLKWMLFDPKNGLADSGAEPVGGGTAKICIKVKQAALWSAECPSLYRILFLLLDENGRTVEAVPQSFGFRKVEIKENIFCFNGKRLVLNGVNRHEFSCRKGRAIGKEEMEWDIRFLKQNNFNAVRTCHYPNQSYWYELCDKFGIYLMDEANLETHGTWHMQKFDHTLPGDYPEWRSACLSRAEAMVERDKNHPSIISWSVGNESWSGKNLYDMSMYFRERDPSRPVHYENVCHDRKWSGTTDFESRMYATVEMAKEYLDNNPAKPYILCEYSHAMGNSCGNLSEYVALADEYPQYCGGFIWDYIDQALVKKDPFGVETLAYGGDFDDRPTDYNFCTDGVIYADRRPSPKMQEVKFLYQPYTVKPDEKGAVVRSKTLFSDGSQYDMIWKLEREGELLKSFRQPFALEPGAKKHITVPGAEDSLPHEAGEYVITVSLVLAADAMYGRAGDEACFGQTVITVGEGSKSEYTLKNLPVTPDQIEEKAALESLKNMKQAAEQPAENEPKIRIIDGDCTFSVAGDGFMIQYNKRYGRLSSLKYGGREMIYDPLNTLLPNFWRAPVDNDEGSEMKIRCSMWKTASLYPAVKEVSCERQGNRAVILAAYELGGGAFCTLRHEVYPDGSISVTESYRGALGLPEMPCFGVSLKLPLDFNKVRWYGLGPEENYIDRMQGARLGCFETTPEASLAGYVVPQECGNRCGVRWFTVCGQNGLGIKVESEEPFEFSALPYTCHELEHARHHFELPRPYATALRILKRQMGVGGDNTWGAKPHSSYLVSSEGEKTFHFWIRRA